MSLRISSEKQGKTTVAAESRTLRCDDLERLLSGKSDTQAISALRAALPAHGSDALWHNSLGVLLYKTGEMDKAEWHLAEAVRLAPEDAMFVKDFADFRLNVHADTQQALELYEGLMRQLPEDVELALLAGHLCIALKRFAQGAQLYRQVIDRAPQQAEATQALHALAERYLTLIDNPAEAFCALQAIVADLAPAEHLQALERFVAHFADCAVAHNDLGVLLQAQGRGAQAGFHHRRAVALDPDNATFKKNLADFCCLVEARMEEGTQLYLQLLAADPTDCETLEALGRICALIGRQADADFFLEKAKQLMAEQLVPRAEAAATRPNPATTPVQMDQAPASEAVRRYGELLRNLQAEPAELQTAALETFLVVYPDHAPACSDLGALWSAAGETEKATACCEQAVRLAPGNANYRKNLADCYVVQQRFAEALGIYQELFQHQPEAIEVALLLGHISVSLRHLTEAERYYRHVLELAPDNAEASSNLQAVKRALCKAPAAVDGCSTQARSGGQTQTPVPDSGTAQTWERYLKEIAKNDFAEIRVNPQRFGSTYGGWEVDTRLLSEKTVVYSFGIGEDISFDLSLIDRFGLTVHGFDPTPKSIAWLQQQLLPKTFVRHAYGVAGVDGQINFNPPENSEHVSHTICDRPSTAARAIVVPMKRLSTIQAELGDQRFDVLKMDIEGAEYEVIDDLAASMLRPGQVLVEFHHRFPGIGVQRSISAVETLRRIGYRLFAISSSREELSFVHLTAAPDVARQNSCIEVAAAPAARSDGLGPVAVEPQEPLAPLVTALVSTCNAERFMPGCLEDLEAQTIAKRLEIIVVDSGSQQGERQIVERFQNSYGNIRFLRTEQRETVYAAWNRAIQISRGRYLASANTDDRHRHDAFEVMTTILDTLPEVGLVYADCIITQRENETFERCTSAGYYRWRNWNRADLLAGHCFMGPQPMWRRAIHEEYGLFDSSFVTSGDYEFWLRISQTQLFLHIPVLLGLYLASPQSIEHRNRERQRQENTRLLTLYRQAHQEKRIIRRPFQAGTQQQPAQADALTTAAVPGSAEAAAVSIVLYASGVAPQLIPCLRQVLEHTQPRVQIALPADLVDGALRDLKAQGIQPGAGTRFVPLSNVWTDPAYLNRAVAATQGKQIVLLSAAALVGPQWLERLQACLNAEPAARMVCAAAKNLSSEQMLEDLSAHIQTYGERNDKRRFDLSGPPLDCVLLERQSLAQLEGFDEEIGDMQWMIADLYRRCLLADGKARCAADVLVCRLSSTLDSVSGPCAAFDKKWAARGSARTEAGKKLQARMALQQADELAQRGQLQQAKQRLLQAIGMLPRWPASYLALARLLLRNRQYAQVLETLAEMPEADRQSCEAAVLRGSAHDGLEQLDEAADSAAIALEANARHAPVLNLMGLIAFQRGQAEEAGQWFRRAIELDPGFGEACTNLGVLYLQAGKCQEALELQERAFVLAPQDSEIATNYHSLLAQLGQMQRAEPLVRDALGFFPASRKLHYFLIDILLQRGAAAEAMAQIEQVLTDFDIEPGMLAAAVQLRAQLGGARSIPVQRRGTGTLSVCMIVKNEQRYLARCLKSLTPVADEIIVVDTGSSDHSRAIAQAFGARVFDFQWVEDFSAARNFSMDQAQGEWILIMDGDEALSPRDHQALRALLADRFTWPAAYLITTRNYQRKTNTIGWTPNNGQYPDEEAGFGWIPTTKVRLVSNDPRLRFHYPVHEMLDPALLQEKVVVRACAIPVHHYGKLDEQRCQHKGEAYFELGVRKLDEMGDSEIALRELATEAELLGRHEESIALWRRYLDLKPKGPFVPDAYVNMATAFGHLRRYQEAVEAAAEAARLDPGMKEARYSQAYAELHRGRAAIAVPILTQVLEMQPAYLPARFVLAAACFCLGQNERGGRELEKLVPTPMGKALAVSFHTLARQLIGAGLNDYATRLLQAAVEREHVNTDILKLLSQLLDRHEAGVDGFEPIALRKAG